MRDEAEIMDELHSLDGELRSFPPNAHWFCPRRHDDDAVNYDNPDEAEEEMSTETKHELIQDAKRRHTVAYKFSLILGLDREISGQLLTDYTQRLNRLFTQCDKCVRNWHRGRKAYLKELAEAFSDETVAELSNRLNSLDFARLDVGLGAAEELLSSEPDPLKRTQGLLARDNQVALLALYEALCSVDYHKSNQKLLNHFDYVFEQVQNKKVLRISDILPAMAQFLFDSNPYRLHFATVAWQKMTATLTTESFDWVVHDVLSEAILRVSQPRSTPEDMQRFWQGVLLILDHMDENLITHSLKAMEVQPSIYQLVLWHLPSDSEDVVGLVIKALRCLLKKSPKSFWESMQTISPATVAEQVFASPGFEKLLGKLQVFDQNESSPAIAWIPDFIASLPAVHQHDACRALLHNLLERMQNNRFSQVARLTCCRAGVNALCTTLNTFVKPDYKVNPTTSLIVINDILGLVDTYKDTVTGFADFKEDDEAHLELKRLGMVVIRHALALDCKALSAEFFTLEDGTPIQRVTRNHSQPIWQAVLDIFRPGNVDLAKSILAATSPLTGLDQLWPTNKKTGEIPKDHFNYNRDFKQLNDNVSRIFQRLSDFDASDLRQMSQIPQTSRPLFAALFSADEAVYAAAVEVVKAMTGQMGKQEAMQSLFDQGLGPVLNSITYAVTRIRKARTFSPIPYMIKIGQNILDALCGNTGILRTRSVLGPSDQSAIMAWWTVQWHTLDMVFSTTEKWGGQVNHKIEYMQNFCRDAMEYAEALLDEHTIIASAVRDSSPFDDDRESTESGSSRDSIRKTLGVVCSSVNGLTMMLRLRDAYLISIITRILSKLLRCLGEYELEIDEFASEFIKSACKRENERGFRKTNLTHQEKAELQRALDEHYGLEVIEMPTPITVKKQSTIESWTKSGDGKRHEPMVPPKTNDTFKMLSEKNRPVMQKLQTSQTAHSVVHNQQFLDNRRKAEEEKKRLNAEAIAKAKALRGPVALVKGEGSGLQGIGGIAGKDHTPVRSEIMVGSSDEESSDDGDDETNSLRIKRKETSKIVAEYEESRRRALLKQQHGPVRKTKIQRSAKDLRARVEPNMDKLYLEILNWELFHPGDTPPSNNQCRRIDDCYLDLDLYKRTFGPLLISEVWRSLVTAKDENNFKAIEIKILNRLSVDKFMEVSTSMPTANNRDQSLMSERDIVLLSKSSNPLNDMHEPHCLARVDRSTRKKDVIEITYRVSREINPALLQCLVPNGKIYALKIADMTTTQREFAALSSLEYYDLCNEVLEAKPSPIQRYGEDRVSSISTKYSLNRGQAQAILSANDNDGFTLIQGPPGSGKTKTIVAMIGALLTPSLELEAEQIRARPQGQSIGGARPAPLPPKKKLLICAPSNAAVDELVARLKEGVQPLNGPRQKINVIRIGRSDAINDSVKDVILDELVRMKLEGDNGEQNKLLQEKNKLYEEAGKIKERLNEIRPQMDAARAGNDKSLELKLQREFDQLKRNQARIGSKIDEEKQSGNTVSRQNEINRRRYQQEIIDGAHVLCATLSGSGHDMFRNLNVEFETVIIDEAAQCIELSALIPLKYGCSKCILVGDPEQLPPTVLSRSAQSFGYEQSLFVRMQRNHPNDVHLLDTQYRMHPEISAFPSQQFYNSRLVDGEGMSKLREKPWHTSTILGPYRFFDVEGVQTKEARGHSFINIPELNAAIKLYERLKTDYRNYDFTGKIGIITSYKAQLNELKARFRQRFGDDVFEEIEFNTTDAFQGRECEIIIFSCVRAKATGGIGFLGDIRRMNVGLTRAKSSLWVLGDSRSLQQGEFWNKLIQDAKARDRYTGGDVISLFSRPTTRNTRPQTLSNPKALQYIPLRTTHGSEPQTYTDRLKAVEDTDVEMLDASSASSSPKSSISSSMHREVQTRHQTNNQESKKSTAGDSISNISPSDTSIKKEPRKPSSMASGMAAFGINQHGKRSREPVEADINGLVKKPHSLKKDSTPDLEAAYAAKNAAKAQTTTTAPSRPSAPPGVPPPRKKAPADPFIQRKKPTRRS